MTRRTLRENIEATLAFSFPVAWYGGLFAALTMGVAPAFETVETYDAPERVVMLEQTFDLSALQDDRHAGTDEGEDGVDEAAEAEPVADAVDPGEATPAQADEQAAAPTPVSEPLPATAPSVPVEPSPEPAELAAAPAAPAVSLIGGIPTERTRNGQVMRSPPKRPSSKSKKKPDCDTDDGIVQVSAEQYTVPRSLVDHYTSNLSEAARLAFVSWNRDDEGEVDGFKVRRMNCANVLRQAGLKNGDVIHAINGRKVTTIPQALKAYTRLRNNRVLKLEVTRKDGSRMHFRYKLS